MRGEGGGSSTRRRRHRRWSHTTGGTRRHDDAARGGGRVESPGSANLEPGFDIFFVRLKKRGVLQH